MKCSSCGAAIPAWETAHVYRSKGNRRTLKCPRCNGRAHGRFAFNCTVCGRKVVHHFPVAKGVSKTCPGRCYRVKHSRMAKTRAARSAWYRRNRDRRRSQVAAYYAQNREMILARRKTLYALDNGRPILIPITLRVD